MKVFQSFFMFPRKNGVYRRGWRHGGIRATNNKQQVLLAKFLFRTPKRFCKWFKMKEKSTIFYIMVLVAKWSPFRNRQMSYYADFFQKK